MDKKTTREIETLTDLDVRCDSLIWLPGAGFAVDAETDALEAFRESLPERDDAPVYKQLPALARFKGGDEWPEFEDLYDALGKIGGFLIQAATPVRRYRTENMWESSWGYYQTEWLYAPSEAKILSVLKAWAEAEHARMKTKSLAEVPTHG